MSNMEIHNTLVRARRILLDEGWCQGILHEEGGAFCARGALFEAMMGDPYGLRGVAHIERYLMQFTHDTRLSHWNDEPGRKLREVLALFERAIAASALDAAIASYLVERPEVEETERELVPA